MPRSVHFHETQRFAQPRLWLALGLIAVSVVGSFGWALYQQLSLGQAWGSWRYSDEALLLASLAVFALVIGIVVLFATMRLIVEVRDEGLLITFRPFTRRLIAFDAIRHCSPRRYQAFRPYAGWGMRGRFRHRALMVAGDEGVWLELRDGDAFLLGSQRAEELAAAIEAARERSGTERGRDDPRKA